MRCLISVHTDFERDLIGEEHGDDFLLVGEVSMIDRVREQFSADIVSSEQLQWTILELIVNST